MEAEDHFRFLKSDQQSCFFSFMAEMRECGDLCDVTLNLEGEIIRVHRVVLAWLSPYFRTMFTSNLKERKTSEITVKDIDRDALKSLIDFAYTSRLEIPSFKVPTLFQTALYLQIDVIREACLQFLYEQISPCSALIFRAYAELSKDAIMTAKADQYVAENFEEVSEYKEFFDLPYHALKDLISRDDLYVLSEEAVWTSVIQWVKASEDERRAHLPDLLFHVRMPLLTPQFLSTQLSTEELIRTTPLCWEVIVEEAKKYHRSLEKDKFRSSGFSIRERYCKKKYHLKCSRVMGYGLYSVNRNIDKKISLDYYDTINKKWNNLCLGKSGEVYHVACTQVYMYLIKSTTFEILDLKTLKWTSKAINGYSLENSGVALDHDKIYFFGEPSLNVVHCLDPRSGICKQVGAMNIHRGRPSTTSLAGDIYVTGGWSCIGNFEFLKSAERYNLTTGRSVDITPMLVRRCEHGCVTLNGKVYSCGGIVPEIVTYNGTSLCEVYDPSTDCWSFVSGMPTQKARLSTFVLSNKLYAVGGNYGRNGFQVESYDPNSDEWTCEEHLSPSAEYTSFRVLLTDSASRF